MIEENDWRISFLNKRLFNTHVKKMDYHGKCLGDHAHCEFCFETISEYDGDLHSGYRLTDTCNCWLCEKCYDDFKELCGFILED